MRSAAKWVCLLTIVLSGAAAGAAVPAARFVDPIQGFSVEVPALGESAQVATIQRLVVAGPQENGFSPNCNVQVQFVAMSVEAFRDLSLRQFATMEFKVHDTKERTVSGRRAVTFEYSGVMYERNLRFAALAVGGEDRIWLLTCTALEEQFEKHRSEFAGVIASFALVERSAAK